MGGSIEQQDDVPTSSMTIAVRIIVLVLAIPTTLLYLRKFVLNNFGLDDWLVLVALIGVDLFSALAYIITYYGLGRPMKYVPTDHLVVFLTLEYASQCAYLVIAATVKASLLIFIMRLFPTRFVHIAGKALLGIIAAFTLSGTLALVFQCRPVQAAYDKAITNSSCYPTETSCIDPSTSDMAYLAVADADKEANTCAGAALHCSFQCRREIKTDFP
ncbi:hypothetical protein AnigIFM59636_002714 [Aspergillus niger]|uniref:Contig An08c0130, genomic contig n=2 Tax=Aspergillus niger TaxID=5061 RepID=A2QRI8_ASPNC|nr:uncharacterized protein An08g06190 [Aspergillus niger]GJP97550.1 unnamed protein product [Aspergillus niger]GKZ98307.1 hypothetical protein AnigIFM59636_002714 [Aspergillus niger]GLA24339.1 hypothetical protein AnigIFM63326_011197 [Aspergillus niger]CAK45589.1 unnamed protein product [Aspergillus niger]